MLPKLLPDQWSEVPLVSIRALTHRNPEAGVDQSASGTQQSRTTLVDLQVPASRFDSISRSGSLHLLFLRHLPAV